MKSVFLILSGVLRCYVDFHVSTDFSRLNPINVLAESNSKSMKELIKGCGELSSYRKLSSCFYNAYEESDYLLSKEYKGLIEYLGGEDKNNLKKAQRIWVKFRDADCHFSDSGDSGDSIVDTNLNSCLASLTIERLERLEMYNKPWNKGCNGCPW